MDLCARASIYPERRHPCLLSLLDSDSHKASAPGQHVVHMVFKAYLDGTLVDLVERSAGPLNPRIAATIFLQVAEGVQCMVSHLPTPRHAAPRIPLLSLVPNFPGRSLIAGPNRMHVPKTHAADATHALTHPRTHAPTLAAYVDGDALRPPRHQASQRAPAPQGL